MALAPRAGGLCVVPSTMTMDALGARTIHCQWREGIELTHRPFPVATAARLGRRRIQAAVNTTSLMNAGHAV